ncbi:MAG: hemin ABC transporter substrate-binding protein [Chloroflexota bacterium]
MRTNPRTVLALPTALLLALLTAGAGLAQEPATVTDVDGNQVVIEDNSRVVTLGGVFTETAYALGAEDKIAAVDASSFFPPEALADKLNFGYYRFLSAEPVLAMSPSLIIGNEETGPPDVVAQLRGAGVPMLLLPDGNDVDAARQLIRTMGMVLDAADAAEELVSRLDSDVAAALELVAGATETPRVLFILQPPGAPMLIAGGDSAAGSMIRLAEAENIYPGFDSYIPMTPEGIVESAPDVILTTDASIEQLGGLDAFLGLPGIAQTPAAENGRIVSMDDLYLLGFGPRTGQAIADLAMLLHPELAP